MSRLFSHTSASVRGHLPSFDRATAWLNSPPLAETDLRDNVVLVEFGTFTCINWLRTLPYVRGWADGYRDFGLVVVIVQTPEFEIEADLESVERAMGHLDLDLPIAVDNDYAIWDAFANRYWPAMYIADADGQIRHEHFGEGGYEKSELMIRELLQEAGRHNLPDPSVPVGGHGIEDPADWRNVKSPETYVGAARVAGFASPGAAVLDAPVRYVMPESLHTNQWALSGDWTLGAEAAVSNESGARLRFRFHARDLHLILAAPSGGLNGRFRVRLDGQPPGDAHGLDVDEDGVGLVTQTRLYQLIRQPDTVEDRLFEIEFLDSGMSAYCFTFG
jgi:hypothetical protein